MEINYDRILDVALRGVRRAAVFMGLGLNAASDPGFSNYQLTDLTAIQLVPDADDETVAQFKNEFAVWITSNGLRELIETFSVFLDAVFDATQHVAVNRNLRTPEYASKAYAQFAQKGVPGKLQVLHDDFAISPRHAAYLSSLYLARNALTHRLGRVEDRDCNEGNELVIRWIGADYVLTTHDGRTIILELPLKSPVHAEAGGEISIRFIEHQLRFSVGTAVKIPAKQIAEICWFITAEARRVIETAIEAASRMGVEVRRI